MDRTEAARMLEHIKDGNDNSDVAARFANQAHVALDKVLQQLDGHWPERIVLKLAKGKGGNCVTVKGNATYIVKVKAVASERDKEQSGYNSPVATR